MTLLIIVLTEALKRSRQNGPPNSLPYLLIHLSLAMSTWRDSRVSPVVGTGPHSEVNDILQALLPMIPQAWLQIREVIILSPGGLICYSGSQNWKEMSTYVYWLILKDMTKDTDENC